MQTETAPEIAGLLDRAAAHCAAHGAKLTALRRRVLELIVSAPSPLGAYDLLERLREADGRPAAPPTVYRALDFLQEHGLVHRLERLAAFVGCVGEADGHAHGRHGAQFLICRSCRHVVELDDPELAAALAHAAARAGFSIGTATIEAEGLCAECRAAPGGSVAA